ncbi:MAG: AI-2E family transporter [Coriobacteriales bacterium]|nr:AI-2E family transporter [Coriobacteriales bacterium]
MSDRVGSWIEYAPYRWLRMWGVSSVLALAIAGAVAAVLWFFGFAASILVPLILAIVLGVIFAPLVTKLEKWRVPRPLGASLVMILVLTLVVGAIWLTISSIVNQSSTIQTQLESAIQKLGAALAQLNIPQEQLDNVWDAVKQALPSLAEGLSSAVVSGLSSIGAFAFGAFLSLYMLFLVLQDLPVLEEWIGDHVGLPSGLGEGVVSDITASLRGYFVGSTIIAFVTSAIIAIALIIFDVPLVGPIALVTFLLSYIPFFGAIIAGAFATLIALGSGGTTTALAILAVVLISQNVVQMPLQSWALGGALKLHPLVVLVATMLGGLLAGIIGATLGAPLTAMAVRATRRIIEAEKLASASAEAATEGG